MGFKVHSVETHTACSISLWVKDGGKKAWPVNGCGTGITSEQSTICDRSCPTVASLDMAALKAVCIFAWLSAGLRVNREKSDSMSYTTH